MSLSDLESLPIEIKDHIFSYLSSRDIINLTLVSKTLNESVGHCRRCMEKFWVKFYSFNLKDLNSLENTCRLYVKIKINKLKTHEQLDYLIHLNQPWKKVLIYNCEFKFAEKYVKFIKAFAPYVEELEITDIEILSYESFLDEKIDFPALKRAMIRNMPSRAIEVFLGSCSNLETVTFDMAHEVQDSRSLNEIIHEFLSKSHKLKHLQLGPIYMRALFGEENQDVSYKFNLSHLLLKFPIANDLPDISYSQIIQFLKCQTDVKWIISMELLNDQILEVIWNELNSLTRISFLGLVELFDLEMQFTLVPKNSLRKLDLVSRKVLISHIGKFLRAAPYLDTLHVNLLNQHMIKIIAKEGSSLKTLYYEHIEENVMEIYRDLCLEENFNKDIVLSQKSFWFDDENPFSLDPIFWRM